MWIPTPILQGSGTEEVSWTCTGSSYDEIKKKKKSKYALLHQVQLLPLNKGSSLTWVKWLGTAVGARLDLTHLCIVEQKEGDNLCILLQALRLTYSYLSEEE